MQRKGSEAVKAGRSSAKGVAENINGEGLRKGAWTEEEDILLRNCVLKYGEGNWHKVSLRTGLKRCRKSCRLRWLNYLTPDIKRGYFNQDEVDLLLRLHKLLGNRWSLIAGRLPGRTANDVKNFWNTHILKSSRRGTKPAINPQNDVVFRPQPRTFSRTHESLQAGSEDLKKQLASSSAPQQDGPATGADDDGNCRQQPPLSEEDMDECIRWWSSLLEISPENNAVPINHKNINSSADDAHVWGFLNLD